MLHVQTLCLSLALLAPAVDGRRLVHQFINHAEGVVANIARGIKWPNGEPWISANTDLSSLDLLFNHSIPLSQIDVISRPRKIRPDNLLRETLDNFETIVLSTVKVGGWRTPWLLALTRLLVQAYSDSMFLQLEAIKGGPACDCEA